MSPRLSALDASWASAIRNPQSAIRNPQSAIRNRIRRVPRVWIVVAVVLLSAARGGAAPSDGAAAVARALLLGQAMPAAAAAAGLPSAAQKRLIEYRDREAAFKSGRAPAAGAGGGEG